MKKELCALLVLLGLIILAGVCGAYTERSTERLCTMLSESAALADSGDVNGALELIRSARSDFIKYSRRACLYISNDSLSALAEGFSELEEALSGGDAGAAYEKLISALRAEAAKQGLSPAAVF